MLKLIVPLLLSGSLLIPCVARLSPNNGQYLLEPLRKVNEWSNRVRPTINADIYSKVQGVWNASWPTIAKLRHESVGKYELPESADRPYSLSKPCVEDLYRFADGVSEMDGWAIQMVDAVGKLPSGLLLGNTHWIGMYEECIKVSSKHPDARQADNSTILGHHCLVNVGDDTPGSNVSMGIELSICVPRTCNSTDVMALFNLVLIEVTDEVHATAADCKDGSSRPLDAGAIAVIIILCVLCVLLILGTCLDVITNKKKAVNGLTEIGHKGDGHVENGHTENESVETGHTENGHVENAKNDECDDLPLINAVVPKEQCNCIFQILDTNGFLHKFLIAFSALANAKKVLSLQSEQTSGDLDALNGMRFLSMAWIIFGHTYMYAIPVANNIADYVVWIQSFFFQPVINGTVAVDTFFVLSGTLSSYSLLLDIRAKGALRNVNWPRLYFHRFWRLTPLYMLLLAIWATLVKYWGSGPFWPEENDANCKTHWWANLLYINNIVDTNSACMGWSWYLSNDMQFFLLMPVFVVLLYKWALLGGVVIFVFMLTSSITTGVITHVNNYPPGTPGMLQIFSNTSLSMQWFQDVYFVPWCRINTYLIGILLGYILYKYSCKLRIRKGLVVLGWCSASVCIVSVLYGLYNVANGHNLGPSVNALYASVHRTAWGVGVAWIILACATGNGGFVNLLLSLPIMLPLSRLTYGAYLFQQIVIFWYYHNLKVPLLLNHITALYLFFGHLVLSYGLSFVFSVLIENPMINLERSFLRSRKKQQPNTSAAQIDAAK